MVSVAPKVLVPYLLAMSRLPTYGVAPKVLVPYLLAMCRLPTYSDCSTESSSPLSLSHV